MNTEYYNMRLKLTPKHSLNQYIFHIKYIKCIEIYKNQSNSATSFFKLKTQYHGINRHC